MKKAQFSLLAVTVVFLCILLGLFIGRNVGQKLTLTSAPTAGNTASNEKIDVNTATASQLMMLPGIGQVLAQRIIDYRQTHGPFESTEDLTLVEGIGDKKLDRILDYITVGG